MGAILIRRYELCFSATVPIALLPLTLLIVARLETGVVVGNALFENRVAAFLGEISSSIYLIPPILQRGCNQIARRLHVPGNPFAALTVLIAELGVFVAAGASCYYLIEVPAHRPVLARIEGWGTPKTATGPTAPAARSNEVHAL